MRNEQENRYIQEIYSIIKTQKLSKREAQVLTNALQQLARQENYTEVLNELYGRLQQFGIQTELHQKEFQPLNDKVQALYQDLESHFKGSAIQQIAGVEDVRAATWKDAKLGSHLTQDEGIFRASIFTFNKDEKYKNIAVQQQKLNDKALNKYGIFAIFKRFFQIFLLVLIGIILLGILVSKLM